MRKNTRTILKTVKPFDILVLLLSLTAAVTAGIFVYRNTGGKPTVVIESPYGTWVYDLETDIEADIPGAEGYTHVVIKDGAARFTDSPCSNKTCIASSPADRPGAWIACLPNQVILVVEGALDDEETDIIAR